MATTGSPGSPPEDPVFWLAEDPRTPFDRALAGLMSELTYLRGAPRWNWILEAAAEVRRQHELVAGPRPPRRPRRHLNSLNHHLRVMVRKILDRPGLRLGPIRQEAEALLRESDPRG